EVCRKLLLAVCMLDDRQHLVVDEVAYRLPHHQLVFTEERVDIHIVDTWETGHGSLLFAQLDWIRSYQHASALSRDIENVRMRIATVDPFRFHLSQPE